MKSLRTMLPLLLALVASVALAQSAETAPSDAQKSFDKLKTLAGSWEGPVIMDKSMDNSQKKPEATPNMEISLRVTSRGNALVHEMKEAGKPDDPAHFDHPVTMFYLDTDRLILTHYCDAGNRPSMVGKVSADGKKVEFDFLDLAGSNKFGHMYHAVFTIIDENHHIEEWTYMMPGDKPMHARMELQRAKPQVASR